MNISEVFEPNRKQTLAITTLFGVEDLVVDELKSLGAIDIEKMRQFYILYYLEKTS